MYLSVDKVIDDVIRKEGGDRYTNHPADRGGPTKFGITLHTLTTWYLKKGIKDEATADDVKNLKRETAIQIYKEFYYFGPEIYKLPESIQPFCFDSAVNHGPKTAIRFVQKACSRNGFSVGTIDGIIGPKTIAAAHKFSRMFLDELIDIRENFYYSIVERDSSQAVFMAGWLNRLREFED